MGRDDNYRCGLAAHPGRSKGAARYDVGLMAHNHRRPALTDTSPRGSPYPEPPNLPSPALPDQRRPTAHRHTRYDSFGTPVTVSEGVPYRYRFSGKRTDRDTSAVTFRWRQYDPPLGRWLTRDALRPPALSNAWAYVDNKPTSYADPLGLYSVKVLDKRLDSGKIDVLVGWVEVKGSITVDASVKHGVLKPQCPMILPARMHPVAYVEPLSDIHSRMVGAELVAGFAGV